MKQNEMFGAAQWVCGGKFPILRGHFFVKNVNKAVLRVLGLGFFHCYLNGKDVTADEFLPLATDYVGHENYPVDEELTGHRIYVPEYDVTDLLTSTITDYDCCIKEFSILLDLDGDECPAFNIDSFS